MLDSSFSLSSGQLAPPRPNEVNSLGSHPTRARLRRVEERSALQRIPRPLRVVLESTVALVATMSRPSS